MGTRILDGYEGMPGYEGIRCRGTKIIDVGVRGLVGVRGY